MWPRNIEIFALVVNLSLTPGIASLCSCCDRIIPPRTFPKRRNNALCGSRHGSDAIERIVDRKLGPSWNCRVKFRGSFVNIVASQNISEEDGVELRFLELLDDEYPVFDVVVLSALISRVFEQSRIQMARRLHSKGIDNEGLLCRRRNSDGGRDCHE